MPSHKTFMIKKKLAKKMRQNRPIPYCIRMRADNTISGSKSKISSSDYAMESKLEKGILNSSILLELAASDDFDAFVREVEEKGLDVNEEGLWYGRRIGLKEMGAEKRTPLMIASLFGSIKVVKYIVLTGKVDVNGVCGSDMVTALHCAVAGGSELSFEVVKLLLEAGAPLLVFRVGLKFMLLFTINGTHLKLGLVSLY
ncbi:hypothetical protein RYX36_009871 [Vicia faba]